MGGNQRSIPGGLTQVNFNISEDLLYKVKYIVLNDKNHKINSSIYNQAIEDFVARWEK
jgi:hypothetical protein